MSSWVAADLAAGAGALACSTAAAAAAPDAPLPETEVTMMISSSHFAVPVIC
ncbi:MAG: hypothetical protein WA673_15090 [Candidatus Acidiferrales bacterium]